jgi:hypothetical protein
MSFCYSSTVEKLKENITNVNGSSFNENLSLKNQNKSDKLELYNVNCINSNNSLEKKKKCLEIKYLECLKKSYKDNIIFENNCNAIITTYQELK